MRLGVIGRPGAPFRATDLDIEHYLWFVEGYLRGLNSENYKTFDDLYEDARRVAAPVATGEARARAIDAFLGSL